MDYKSMKYFLAIAEEETISKAAKKLRMAQPPLTRQLQLLEEELGVQLFIREQRKMILTEEGLFFRERCSQILSLMDKTKTDISHLNENLSGTIYIAAIETIAGSMLPEIMKEFSKKYPQITYNLWSGGSDEVQDRMEKGFADIGIVKEPYDIENFEGIAIAAEPYVAMISAMHPLASIKEEVVTLEELSSHGLIVTSRKVMGIEILKWFEKINKEPQIVCEYNTLLSCISMVEQNMGAVIVPLSAMKAAGGKNILVKKIVEPEYSTTSVLAWSRWQTLTKTVKLFFQEMQSFNKSETN